MSSGSNCGPRLRDRTVSSRRSISHTRSGQLESKRHTFSVQRTVAISHTFSIGKCAGISSLFELSSGLATALLLMVSEFLGRSHSNGAERCGSKERVGNDYPTGAEVLPLPIIGIVKER